MAVTLTFKVRGSTATELMSRAESIIKTFAPGYKFSYDVEVEGEQLNVNGAFGFVGHVAAEIRG